MKKMVYSVYEETYVRRLCGDRIEDGVCVLCDPAEHGDFDSRQQAVAEADTLASAAGAVRLHTTRYGVGCIEHAVFTVQAFIFDGEAGEYEPCSEDGGVDGGIEPVYVVDALDSRAKIKDAFQRAVESYWGFCDYETEGFHTVFQELE